jgi:large subunit ribosomal protein L11
MQASSKKVPIKLIKLIIAAGKANPAPPIGPALGQHGLNIMDFCKKFNEKTKSMGLKEGTRVPVVISVFKDKSFDFIVKTPPVPDLIKEALGIQSASKKPGIEADIAKITKSQVEKIAKVKQADLSHISIPSICEMVKGTARSMGIGFIED